jgi:membrane protease YdiL (CAAX protease family)
MAVATSPYFFVPLVGSAFFTIRALSRTRLARGTIPVEKPQSVEVRASIVLMALPAIGYFLLYLVVPWESFGRPSEAFKLTYYALFVLLPVLLALRFLGKGLDSVRLTTVNWKFSMVLGFSASLVTLIPTVIVDPELIGILASKDWLYYLAVVYGVFNEELLFRGFVQTRMEGLLGVGKGLFLTALAFELVHLPSRIFALGYTPEYALVIMVATIVPSLLMGYIAQRSGNLLGSTIFHLFYGLPLMLLP